MFTQLTISHQNPETTCSLRSLLPDCLKFLAAISICWVLLSFIGLVVVGFSADCPLLSTAGSLFLPLGSPPHSALPLLGSPLFSPPSPALASNGLNRLASCQSRGLLWLCHKSARKNRNHLFRPGPERGWGCKYMSLALALSPARVHRTTEPSGRLPLSLNQHSHPQLYCSLERFHG